jgi:MFS family permease
MFAVFSSAWVLPGIIGPAVSGAVSDHIGWRVVFLGLLPLVLLAGVMTVRSLQAITPVADVVVPDRRVHALLVTAGAGLVLAAISARSMWAAIPLAIVGAAIGIPAFMRLVPPGTLRLAPGLPAAVGTRGLLTFAFFGVDAYISLALTSLRGTSTTLAGVALTAATLTWTAGSWIQERRVHTVGPRALVRAGFFAIAVGIGLMILVVEIATPVAVAVIAWAVAGLGMGIAYSPLSLIVLAYSPPGSEGRSTASLQLSDVLGIALGTGAAGAIVSSGAALGWDPATALLIAFAGLGGIAVLGSVAAQRLPDTLREAR